MGRRITPPPHLALSFSVPHPMFRYLALSFSVTHPMFRSLRGAFVALLLALIALPLTAAPAAAQSRCGFVLGFASIRTLVGQNVVGDCRENEHFNPANGNAEQQTMRGLLVWRKADNWTAFTDGFRTWVNGPQGLQQRLNTQRFAWEADAAAFAPAVPAASSALPAAGDPAAPVLAWYYPQFSQGTATDMRNAASARIDALIISETGASDLAPFASAARAAGTHVALGLEPQMHGSPDALVARLQGVLNQFGRDAGYLRYQGKPVIVFWNLPSVPKYPGQTAQQTWQTIRSRVDPNRTSLWIAEGGDTNASTGTLSYMPAFDALHLYSVAWDADPARALAGWANRLRGYDASKLWVATVMPGGYYGTGSSPANWSSRDRADGAYYRAAWQGAINTAPAMVIVTSFNETKERTEIHPTSAWGSLYIDVTRDMATAWHG
jgi:hypothetical protein